MTDMNTTLERLKSANTVPSTDSFPNGAWSSDALLARIDERSTTVADLKTAPPVHETKPTRNRGPLIAFAVAAVLLVVVGVVGLLAQRGQEGTPADERPPIEDVAPVDEATTQDALSVVTDYNRLYDSGDVAGYEALYDPNRYDVASSQAEHQKSSRYIAVTGMTVDRDCTADDGTVVCVTTRTSGLDPDTALEPFTATYTVADGLITGMAFTNSFAFAYEADIEQLTAYHDWMRAAHPPKAEDLFGSLLPTSLLLDTADERRFHRGLIDQYFDWDPIQLEVSAGDFRFDGLLTEVPLRSTIELTNASDTEFHQIVVFQLEESDTRTAEEFAALTVAEISALRSIGELHAMPGEDAFDGRINLLSPGRYLAVDMVPAGADASTVRGAVEEFTPPFQVPGGLLGYQHGMLVLFDVIALHPSS